MTYRVNILGVLSYYKYIISYFGWSILGLTDSHYPRFLALGWCLKPKKEIVICRLGNWELRKWHELGHTVGFKHVMKRGHVMHPWGFLRGYDGVEEIKEKMNKKVIK